MHLTMSSINNEEIFKSINKFLYYQPSYINKKQLIGVINDIYSKHQNDDNYQKPKRKLSAYNLFVKENMKKLKDIKISSREKMKRVAIMWNEYKKSQEKKEDEDYVFIEYLEV